MPDLNRSILGEEEKLLFSGINSPPQVTRILAPGIAMLILTVHLLAIQSVYGQKNPEVPVVESSQHVRHKENTKKREAESLEKRIKEGGYRFTAEAKDIAIYHEIQILENDRHQVILLVSYETGQSLKEIRTGRTESNQEEDTTYVYFQDKGENFVLLIPHDGNTYQLIRAKNKRSTVISKGYITEIDGAK